MLRSEVACSQLCQHPACWKANNHCIKQHSMLRQSARVQHSSSNEPAARYCSDDLPTQSVVNIMQQFDDIMPQNLVPKHVQPKPKQNQERNVSSKKQHRQREMSMNVLNLERSARSTPCNSPGSRRSSNSAVQSPTINSGPGVSSVEIHEIFEPNDLHENWQETFLTRSCYVWVPKRQRQTENSSLAIDNKSSSSKPVLKDVTEEMLPLEIENSREANIVKKETHKLPPIMAMRGYFPKKSDKETAGSLSLDDDLLFNAGDMGSLAFIDTLTQRKMKLWDGTSRAVKLPLKDTEQVYKLDERLDALKSASTLFDPDKMRVEISTVPRMKSKASRVAMPTSVDSQETRAFVYKQNKPELKLSPIPSTTSFSRSRNVHSAESTSYSHDEQQHASPFEQCAECQAKMAASSAKLPRSSEDFFAADRFIPPQPPSTPQAMHSPQRTPYSNFASPEHRNYSPQRAVTRLEDTSAAAGVSSQVRVAPVAYMRSASKDEMYVGQETATHLSTARGIYALRETPASLPVYQASDYITSSMMHHASSDDANLFGTSPSPVTGAYVMHGSLENFLYSPDFQSRGQVYERERSSLSIHGEGLHVVSRHDALRGQSAAGEMVTKPSPWKLDEGTRDANMILVNLPQATITEASVEDVDSARREIPAVPYSMPPAGRVDVYASSAPARQELHGRIVVGSKTSRDNNNNNDNNTRRERSRSPGVTGGGRMPLAMRVAYLGEIPMESSRVPQASARTATVNYEPAVNLDSLKLEDYGVSFFRTVPDEPVYDTPYPSLVVEASAITFGSKQADNVPVAADSSNSDVDTKQTTFMTQEQEPNGAERTDYNSNCDNYNGSSGGLEGNSVDATASGNVEMWDSAALESMAQYVVNMGLHNAAAVLMEASQSRLSGDTPRVNDDHLDMFGATDASLRQQLEDEYKKLSS